MTPTSRFTDELIEPVPQTLHRSLRLSLLFSVAPRRSAAPASSIQSLYQRMYEDAQKATRPQPMPATRAICSPS